MQTPNPEQFAPQPFRAKAWDERSVELLRQAVLTSPMGVVVPQEAMLDLLATIDQAQEQVRVQARVSACYFQALVDLWEQALGGKLQRPDIVTRVDAAMKEATALANTTPAPQQGEEGKA